MAKANTAPLSGMRDFLPLDVLRRNYVIDVIERVYQSHGFEPLETPSMERLDTLLGKYGEEGDQLIFRILKRGDKLQRALDDDPTESSVADAGIDAVRQSSALMAGLNTYAGKLTYKGVADAFDLPYTAPESALDAST